jgi:Tfp pilus assembly protein FimT
MRARRGFTLSEITIILVVLGVLSGVFIPTYLAVHNKSANTSGSMTLSGAVSQARGVAARQGNHYQYPSDLAVVLDSMNPKYTDAAAFSNTDVSVYRSTSDIAYFATLIEGKRCVVVKDDIATDTQMYAVDSENTDCIAANADGMVITGTYDNPSTIDVDS